LARLLLDILKDRHNDKGYEMRGAGLAVVAAICLSAVVRADEICLKEGGCLQGVILEQTATAVTIEIGPGRITLPTSRIERLSVGRSALASYYERKRGLKPMDVRGWLELARWARDSGLATQANAAYEHVLDLDADNPEANQALGKTLVGERWLTQEEAYRARGYTYFEGSWIPREERDALLEKRRIESEAAVAEAARAEADARRAEAEARARAAEAEELASEARAAQEYPGGVWGWGLGVPCTIDHPCPPVSVECGPHMSGPACRSEDNPQDPGEKPRVRPSPPRSVKTRRDPAALPPKKHSPKAKLPDGN
jgi:hypothetical protein